MISRHWWSLPALVYEATGYLGRPTRFDPWPPSCGGGRKRNDATYDGCPDRARNSGPADRNDGLCYPLCFHEKLNKASEQLGIPPPEMVFGKSSVSISNESGSMRLSFDAVSALQLVDKKNDLVKVACAEAWSKHRYFNVLCPTVGPIPCQTFQKAHDIRLR